MPPGEDKMWVVLGEYIRIELDNHNIMIGPTGIVLFLQTRNLKKEAIQFLTDKLGANASDKAIHILLTPPKVRNLVDKVKPLRNLDNLVEFLDALLSTDPKLINEAVDNLLRLKTS